MVRYKTLRQTGYILCNFAESGSEKFEQFLNLLGERIRLKGWDKYRGGLDIKGKFIIE